MIYDAIVIGSGLAGLNAALGLSKRGKVLLITKEKLKDSNTWYAQGGIAAAIGPSDSVQKHIDDTLIAGHYKNDLKAVEFIIKRAPEAIKQLQKLGIKFTTISEQKISLHREGGHREARIIHHKDQTGKAIEEGLIKKIKNLKNLTILEHAFAKDLIIENDQCVGISVIQKNRTKNWFGKITILAAGGFGQLYKKTTNPINATGDGIAMAARAKVKLKDLHYVQFHPTALDIDKSPLPLLTEALRGAGAYMVNSRGERFMLKKHKLAELAPRDIVSSIIVNEQKKGKVYLDLRHIKKAELKKSFPAIYKIITENGFKPDQELIPITPAAHYACGGISTNLKGETSIKRLYACGEVAYTGLHGANRLASNSLLEALIMSNQVIKAPFKELSNKNFDEQKSMNKKSILQKSDDQIITTLKNIMWEHAGISQTKKGLQTGLKKIQSLQKNYKAKNLIPENMLQTGALVIQSSIENFGK
jgi:L-aspartate oxidase